MNSIEEHLEIEVLKRINEAFEFHFHEYFEIVSSKEKPRISTIDDVLDLLEQTTYEEIVNKTTEVHDDVIEEVLDRCMFRLNYDLSKKLYDEGVIDLDGNIKKHAKRKT